MRANSCLYCLLLALLLAAAPLLVTAISQAQPAAAEPGNDLAPAPDDEEEEGGNDTAEREGRRAPDTSRRDYQLGLVRRLDSFDPDADEANGAASPHPVQLAHPDHDVVICEAGCDGPAGAIVYLQKRQPRHVE
jgi:hypothetical protein